MKPCKGQKEKEAPLPVLQCDSAEQVPRHSWMRRCPPRRHLAHSSPRFLGACRRRRWFPVNMLLSEGPSRSFQGGSPGIFGGLRKVRDPAPCDTVRDRPESATNCESEHSAPTNQWQAGMAAAGSRGGRGGAGHGSLGGE